MTEEKLFARIVDLFNVYFRIMYSYQNTPRRYGTEEELYMAEAHVIQAIGDNPGLSLNELAETTYRTKYAMSMMIKNLDEKGLVKNDIDPEDKRRHKINLTEKGKTIYEYHTNLDAENYRETLDSMRENIDISLEDLIEFHKILEIYNSVLEERI